MTGTQWTGTTVGSGPTNRTEGRRPSIGGPATPPSPVGIPGAIAGAPATVGTHAAAVGALVTMVTAEASPGIHNVTSSGTLVTMATAEALPDIHNVTSINNNGAIVAEIGTDLHRTSTIGGMDLIIRTLIETSRIRTIIISSLTIHGLRTKSELCINCLKRHTTLTMCRKMNVSHRLSYVPLIA